MEVQKSKKKFGKVLWAMQSTKKFVDFFWADLCLRSKKSFMLCWTDFLLCSNMLFPLAMGAGGEKEEPMDLLFLLGAFVLNLGFSAVFSVDRSQRSVIEIPQGFQVQAAKGHAWLRPVIFQSPTDIGAGNELNDSFGQLEFDQPSLLLRIPTCTDVQAATQISCIQWQDGAFVRLRSTEFLKMLVWHKKFCAARFVSYKVGDGADQGNSAKLAYREIDVFWEFGTMSAPYASLFLYGADLHVDSRKGERGIGIELEFAGGHKVFVPMEITR